MRIETLSEFAWLGIKNIYSEIPRSVSFLRAGVEPICSVDIGRALGHSKSNAIIINCILKIRQEISFPMSLFNAQI